MRRLINLLLALYLGLALGMVLMLPAMNIPQVPMAKAPR
jgi:hypothetical protein